ncbi:MAG: acyl carrier protein [Spirochaetales bacterium]|jgi:acyl carrier protein|nr:acyl carrier protein [Spirochaetales bacterium]MBQ2295394.1 acyl carrier protein [Spirochaetales bacterium]
MVDKDELKKVILTVAKSDDDISSITDDTVLIGEDGLFFDSIDVLELIVEIEKKFGIKIKDKDLNQNKLDSFQIFYDFVNENAKK